MSTCPCHPWLLNTRAQSRAETSAAHVILRYSEESGRCVGSSRCFGVPQHDKWRSIAHGYLVIALCCFAGCGPTRNEMRAEHAVEAYFASDFRDAARRLRPLADKTDENFVLNNCRLGSAA